MCTFHATYYAILEAKIYVTVSAVRRSPNSGEIFMVINPDAVPHPASSPLPLDTAADSSGPPTENLLITGHCHHGKISAAP